MDIVILVDFLGNMNGSSNSRFLYLANLLYQEHDVEVITSDFDHGSKSYFEIESRKFPFNITMLHEDKYPKNVCLRRFWGHWTWGRSVKRYLENRKQPDVIYCAIPTLTASYYAGKYCERNNIRFVIDVQDLWPEAFQMVVHIPVVSTIIFTPFRIFANKIYRQADAICGVSDTYCKRVADVNIKCTDSTTVFLGTELSTFDRYVAENPKLTKDEGEIWLGYCGTLGNSYDLTCVIDALALLDFLRIKFIVMGDGPRKEEFEIHAKSRGVNAEFTGYLKYDAMCSLLSSCDIAINPITRMAAQSIINKHADYAAAGIPVISTQECDEYRNLVTEYHMGFNCRNNDAVDLATKIEILAKNRKLRTEMGKNARKCAEQRFNRECSYKKLCTTITGD